MMHGQKNIKKTH